MDLKKIIFWVAWWIASGKTYFCNNLINFLLDKDIPTRLIEVDSIRRYILYISKEPHHYNIRTKLIQAFWMNENKNNFLNPSSFWKIIFSKSENMKKYRELVNPEIINIIHQKINILDGIILVEWAMLIEDWMLSLVDNNVILLNSNKNLQLDRLKNGDLPNKEVLRRIEFTDWLGFIQRKDLIQKIQGEEWFWIFIPIDINITLLDYQKTVFQTIYWLYNKNEN
ncbi:MAG: hypothetical protein ACD_49C00064G0034 [uncultured bacterium (gcode 4)]|uniref:Dephospho-CoA kinase n=1 Tax=uncultured bacterium (gcode 4) TaxID=1234023 RepID=K2AWU0_9BACT|nr:MAG: hypothetical protein ACD_49C00064G0034 [uncultured bacterium (gcode 4)]